MIIKTLTRPKNPGQLLQYVHKEILRYVSQDKNLNNVMVDGEKPFLIRHNVKSRSIEGYIKEFALADSRRIHTHSRQTALHHVIISFGDNDHDNISDAMLHDFARKFIELRAENCLVVGSAHRGKTDRHKHLHFAVSSTTTEGMSSAISKARLAEIKLLMTEYQKKYPQLIHSEPQHGSKRAGIILLSPRRQGSQSKKEILEKQLKAAKKDAGSMTDLLEFLKHEEFLPYYRGSKELPTGITYKGRKYRFKTLGFDLKTWVTDLGQKKTITNLMKEIEEIRSRGKENEASKDTRDERLGCLDLLADQKSTIDEIKQAGDGEASPYTVSHHEMPTVVR